MKKIFLVLLLGIFLMGIVSSASFDNVKTFHKEKGEKYGTYKIKNWFGLGSEIEDITLKSNTETCSNDCSAVKEITLYEDSSLVDSVRFETINKDDSRIEQSIRSYQFYIQTGETEKTVDDYEDVCSGKKIVLNNGTLMDDCSSQKVGSHKESVPIWTEYQEGTVMLKGTYNLKLEGSKREDRNVDWIITANGEELNEWAVWGQSTLKTGLIAFWTFNESSGTTAYDSLFKNNITVSNTWGNGKIGASSIKSDASNPGVMLTGIKTDVTYNLWINSTSTGTTYWGGNGATGNNCVWSFYKDSASQTFGFNYYNWQVGGSAMSSVNNAYVLNNFVMFSITVNKTGQQLFLNGVLTAVGSKTCGVDLFSPVQIFSHNDVAGGTGNTYDEWGMWNRTLTQNEITQLYNSGTGLTYSGLEQSSVNLNSPLQNYSSSNSNVLFNCSAIVSGVSTLVNISLWNNESGTFKINETLSRTGTYNESILTKSFSDGAYLWTCSACDSDGVCGFANENRTLYVDASAPSITIINPTSLIDYGYLGKNISLNYLITDIHLDKCWYEYGGVNTTLSCNANSSFILTNQNNITLYANDTAGNLNSQFLGWTYKTFSNSVSYNNITTSFSSENYILNFTYNNSFYNGISGVFYYGTSSSPSTYSTDGINYYLTSTNIIPSVTSQTNKSFYWEVTLNQVSGGTTVLNTTSYNQTVNPLTIDNCSSNTYRILNYTMFDEGTNSLIANSLSPSIEYDVRFSSITNPSNYMQFSGTVNNNNLSICISNSSLTSTLRLDSTVKYKSENRVSRFNHIQNQTIFNLSSPIDIILRDLNSSEATQFNLVYTTGSFSPQVGYVLEVQRYYTDLNSTNLTTETAITDSSGTAQVYLTLNSAYYRVMAKLNGKLIEVFEIQQAKCQTAPCSINLPSTKGNPDLPIIVIGNMLEYSYTFNKTSGIFKLSFNKIDGLASLMRLDYSLSNGTSIGSTSLTAVTGVLSSNNLSQYQGSTVVFYLYQDGTYVNRITVSVPRTTQDFGGLTVYLLASFMFLIIFIMAYTNNIAMLIMELIGFISMGALNVYITDDLFISSVFSGVGIAFIIFLIIYKLNQRRDSS